MLNFYRRFLPHAAATQAPLHTLLAGPRTKGSKSINWTPELNRAFEDCKANLSRATILAHPDGTAPIALVTDASTTVMGAVLQQRTTDSWQPLTFFSKKMSRVQQKYSAYDRELLAIYEAVKHFRHMLEERDLHRPQATDLLLQPEARQGQPTAVKISRLYIAVHDGHPAYLRTRQCSRRRSVPRGSSL